LNLVTYQCLINSIWLFLFPKNMVSLINYDVCISLFELPSPFLKTYHHVQFSHFFLLPFFLILFSLCKSFSNHVYNPLPPTRITMCTRNFYLFLIQISFLLLRSSSTTEAQKTSIFSLNSICCHRISCRCLRRRCCCDSVSFFSGIFSFHCRCLHFFRFQSLALCFLI
jgi:hypothetical protein